METFSGQTFSFAEILKESFPLPKNVMSKGQPSSGGSIKAECSSGSDFVSQHADQSEMLVSTGDSSTSEKQSRIENAVKPNPQTNASSALEDASVSITEDQSFQSQGLVVTSNRKRDAAIAGLEDLVVSYVHLSESTDSIFKDISCTMAVDSSSERQSSVENTNANPLTNASSTLEDTSVSITEDQSFQTQGPVETSKRKGNAAMPELEDLVVSYMHLSESTDSIFNDISCTMVADSEVPTSCSQDHSMTDEMTSMLEDVSVTSESVSNLETKSTDKTSHRPAEQFKQPPQKKIKLDKSVKIPLRDVLAGAHTKLCKTDCTSKHNPFVLAICAPDDYKLKRCMENHLKLATKGAWTLDPKLFNYMHRLVHLAVMFGKNNLLESLLKVCLDRLELYVDSNQKSPLHTLMESMHKYMPSSSHREKVSTLQRTFQLLAKYNCNVFLTKDKDNEDTILHVCAKQIRKQTNQMKSIESLGQDMVRHQALLEQRELLEGIFKELIHMLKRLCNDGSLLHSQVIELFDCANKAGETMSQILLEDGLERKKSTVVACSEVTSTVSDAENAEDTEQQKVHENHCEDAITDKSTAQLSTVTEISSTCTTENHDADVLNQMANPMGRSVHPAECPSGQRTVSVAKMSTQTVGSTEAEICTRTTNCASVPAEGEKLLTTLSQAEVSTSQAGNFTETTSLSTNCPSVLGTPNRHQNTSALTTVSASLWIPPSFVSTQVAHSACPPVQTPSVCQHSVVTTTVSSSLWVPPSFVPTQVAHSACSSGQTPNRHTVSASLWVPPSPIAPSEGPKQSTSTTTSVRIIPTEVASSSGHQDPSTSTTVTASLWAPPSPLAPNGRPKESTSTTSSARIEPAQVENSNITTNFSINHLLGKASKGHQNPNASTTVSASLWVPPSPLAPIEWPKESTSTTTSVRMIPTEVATSSGSQVPKLSTAVSASLWVPPSPVAPDEEPKQSASVTASARMVSTQVENSSVTTTSSTNSIYQSVAVSNVNVSNKVTASLWVPPCPVAPSEEPKQFASTTVSVPTQVENSNVTTNFSVNHLLGKASNGHQKPNASTTVSASLWVPPSPLTPNELPKQSAATTASVPQASMTVFDSLQIPKTVLSPQVTHSVGVSVQTSIGPPNPNSSTGLTAPLQKSPSFVPMQAAHSVNPNVQRYLHPGGWMLPRYGPPVTTPIGYQNHNATITVTARLRTPPRFVPTQMARSVCSPMVTPNGYQNHNASSTLSASLWVPPSPLEPNGWLKQSTLTTASVRMGTMQVEHPIYPSLQTPTGHYNFNSVVTAPLWRPPSFVPPPAAQPGCSPILTHNGRYNHNASTTVSTSLRVPPSPLTPQSTVSASLWVPPSPLSPSEWPKQSTSTTASARTVPTQVAHPVCSSFQVLHERQNHNASTTVSASMEEPSSPLAPNSWPKDSTSTTSSISIPVVPTMTQGEHFCGTTSFSSNDSSDEASSGCHTTSTTVSVSTDTRVLAAEMFSRLRDLPTMLVDTELQKPKKGNHTFLCKPDCCLRHHQLIQLLCATPDHLSTDGPAAEIESCKNLRHHLHRSQWALPNVVPDLAPYLQLPIVHLACLLGKHKALEVLAEFRFHALVHTAKTEATPLHMTVQLLRHQTSNTIFLCEVIVSILKTLNQHSHAISLFSAKDNKGNSVLHAMAELLFISSSVPEPASLLYVYLFRVFIYFLLKGQQDIPLSESLQILSSCLKDCNKAGEDVESLLEKSVPGKQVLEYLTGLIQSGVQVTSNETQEVDNGKEKLEGPEGQHDTPTFQEHNGSMSETSVNSMSDEPVSLVDFLLSADCKISIDSKRKIMECYVAEYNARLELVNGKMELLKEEIKDALSIPLTQQKIMVRDELKNIEVEIGWYSKKLKLMKSELEQKKRYLPPRVKKLNYRLQLINKLKCKLEKDNQK